MSIKKLMAETAKKVDFFNTLTDKDIEMIEFIDKAQDQGLKPNLKDFEEEFSHDTRPRNELLSDISRKYIDYLQKIVGTGGTVITTLGWFDPHHEGYHEVGSDKEIH
jgi:hypothetical protein|tara:strand:- start:66 stop:386 length:321 start_codon:yes stop_codon:yes gene_type:complete